MAKYSTFFLISPSLVHFKDAEKIPLKSGSNAEGSVCVRRHIKTADAVPSLQTGGCFFYVDDKTLPVFEVEARNNTMGLYFICFPSGLAKQTWRLETSYGLVRFKNMSWLCIRQMTRSVFVLVYG